MPIRVPDEFLVFVNEASHQAQHNLAITRTFTSRCYSRLVGQRLRDVLAPDHHHLIPQMPGDDPDQPVDLLPFVPNPCMNPKMYSPFTSTVMTNYRLEWDAEQCRLRHFPTYPSRLSAIFAFGSQEDCFMASQKHDWPLREVRRFRLEDTENFIVIRVNMEVVSMMRDVYGAASWDATALDGIWRHYWSGQGNLAVEAPTPEVNNAFARHKSGVIWEWLVEGKLVCDDLRPVFPDEYD